jgi:hypothetical protein
MDFYKKYSEIVADYNREKDRVTIEETFAKLVDLANSLDAEQRRAAEEGLSEEELALFDLLKKPEMTKVDRERVKQASRGLLASIRELIAPLERWTEKEQTQAGRSSPLTNSSESCRHLRSRPMTSMHSRSASINTSGSRARIQLQRWWRKTIAGHRLRGILRGGGLCSACSPPPCSAPCR